MGEQLFTPENSRLAALVHGDPNEVHLNNRFGKTIAPGLMQLQGLVALNGWKEDNLLYVDLVGSIVVPSTAEYEWNGRSYLIKDGTQTCAISRTEPSSFKPCENALRTYDYELTSENVDPESIDWKNYKSIPLESVRSLVPATDSRTLEKLSFVGASANALVRYLAENPDFYPDMFFPQAREQGKYAVLEQRLVLHMGKCNEEAKKARLGVFPGVEIDEKTFVASIGEMNGMFNLDIYLKKIPRKVFERLLR